MAHRNEKFVNLYNENTPDNLTEPIIKSRFPESQLVESLKTTIREQDAQIKFLQHQLDVVNADWQKRMDEGFEEAYQMMQEKEAQKDTVIKKLRSQMGENKEVVDHLKEATNRVAKQYDSNKGTFRSSEITKNRNIYSAEVGDEYANIYGKTKEDIAQMKVKKLEELKLQVMAQNPTGLMIPVDNEGQPLRKVIGKKTETRDSEMYYCD